MLSALGPDANSAIGVLYTSQDSLASSKNGYAVIVSTSDTEANSSRGTLCAVMSFPDLVSNEDLEDSGALLRSITNYVEESFFQSNARGVNALQGVLEGLHLYVQFLNNNALQVRPIQGSVTLAEVKDYMLYVVYCGHTFNIVTKYGEADTFPPQRLDSDILVGSSQNLGDSNFRSYQAELNNKGLFFLGTDDWYRHRESVQAQKVLKQVLVQSVADAIGKDGRVNTLPFERRNPDRRLPGLLMGFPPSRQASVEEGKTTFVTPGELDTDEDEKMKNVEELNFNESIEGSSEEFVSTATMDTKGNLELQSAWEHLEKEKPWVPPFLRRTASKAGVRLTRWFSEVFPDPQIDATAQDMTDSRPSIRTGIRTPVTPVVVQTPDPDFSAQMAPTKERDPNSLNEVLRKVQDRYQSNLKGAKKKSAVNARSWAGMTLLLLLIVVPIATWVAYTVREIPTPNNANNVAEMTQLHLDAAHSFLLREQMDLAQRELQSARHLLQSLLDLGGLTPQLNNLQHELDTLWMDAFRITPLVGLTDPLVTFGRDEEPAKVVVNIQDLFLLMESRVSQVVKYRLDLLANGEQNQRQVILREGDLVEGVRVGQIVDMAFQPAKTAHSDKPSLYLLDDQLNVFQYNDTDQVSVVELGQKSTWEEPTLIDFYSNRMYVADAGSGQIWRYNLNSTDLQQEAWLAEPTNLNSAIRMHVDNQIWLLLDNNSIVVYGSDRDSLIPANIQKPFALHSAIALESRFVDLEIGSNQSNFLLLPDPGQQSILVMDKVTGDFLYQLAAPESESSDFDRLRDVNLHRERLYILTKNFLYQHSFAP